jgi:hypothetical protein
VIAMVLVGHLRIVRLRVAGPVSKVANSLWELPLDIRARDVQGLASAPRRGWVSDLLRLLKA